MANHKQHLALGAAAGAGTYLLISSLAGKSISLPELIGAVLSGSFSAKLPDILEPAIHPNHRSTFHSIGFLGVASPVAWSRTEEKRQTQVRLAEDCEARAARVSSEQERAMWARQAWWHRFLAGLWLGLVPGYVSHLAADALTPKGLPLLK